MPLEPVLALLLRVLPVQEQVQILKDALEGIVQVLLLILSDPDTNFMNLSGWLLGSMDTLEQLQPILWSRNNHQNAFLFGSQGWGEALLRKGPRKPSL